MRLTVSKAARNLRVAIPTAKHYGDELNIDWRNFTISDQERIRELLKSKSQSLVYSKERAWRKFSDKQDRLTIQELVHITNRDPSAIRLFCNRNGFGNKENRGLFTCSAEESQKIVEYWQNRPFFKHKNNKKYQNTSKNGDFTSKRTISITKIARKAGVCGRTVHYYIQRNKIGMKRGGKWFLSKDEAEKVLSSYRHGEKPEVKPRKAEVPVQSNYLIFSNNHVRGFNDVEQVKTEIRRDEDAVVFQKMETRVDVKLC